ncbi:hypothetical protein [Actinokineospora globicatena]|uniref:hypothetical protein n=1 Tax=Actinokineospora globicatena TaxID=103729 RepID=UPI0020A5FBE2|nr:hypothetical protein [Actinokineospora globicatena]MCP2303663.1 hypothetical protein [Actinokineospora globicatena]GLW79200.1 hypothetical protein Aglo01_36820 [Actinokineospora globicatena]GLW86390.1 hypothetical protein Aglo02_40290 [Actinokineospora globicatena]
MADYPQPWHPDRLDRDAFFDSLLDEALTHPEVREVLGRQRITEEALRLHARGAAEAVFAVGRREEGAWRTVKTRVRRVLPKLLPFVVIPSIHDDSLVRPTRFSELEAAARRCLSEIRYVRTYGSERGAKAGFKGFEVSGKTALSLAGRALTYPEAGDHRDRRAGPDRARVYFTATVIDVFTEDLTRARMPDYDFDILARAKRYAGTKPATALALITDLRTEWTLPIINPSGPRNS